MIVYVLQVGSSSAINGQVNLRNFSIYSWTSTVRKSISTISYSFKPTNYSNSIPYGQFRFMASNH